MINAWKGGLPEPEALPEPHDAARAGIIVATVDSPAVHDNTAILILFV